MRRSIPLCSACRLMLWIGLLFFWRQARETTTSVRRLRTLPRQKSLLKPLSLHEKRSRKRHPHGFQLCVSLVVSPYVGGTIEVPPTACSTNMSGSHLSKDFFELVKAIGESKSKQVHLLRCSRETARRQPSPLPNKPVVPWPVCVAGDFDGCLDHLPPFTLHKYDLNHVFHDYCRKKIALSFAKSRH
jgi:hypothetical protein